MHFIIYSKVTFKQSVLLFRYFRNHKYIYNYTIELSDLRNVWQWMKRHFVVYLEVRVKQSETLFCCFRDREQKQPYQSNHTCRSAKAIFPSLQSNCLTRHSEVYSSIEAHCLLTWDKSPKGRTSAIRSLFVRSITSLSIPMPQPPVGGRPHSRVSTKDLSGTSEFCILSFSN